MAEPAARCALCLGVLRCVAGEDPRRGDGAEAVYVALGVRPDGSKEILGLWIEQTEGAKFWLRVMNELRNRGVLDMLIAVVDGLKGFPEAINAVFPEAQIQTCIVHLIRHSLAFASWKERREVAAALKPIYRAANATLVNSWTNLPQAIGVGAIPPLPRPGSGNGNRSCRSSPIPWRCAKSSTQRMR
jgi:putative transposase